MSYSSFKAMIHQLIAFSRLLELLLDTNNSAQIPLNKRVDLKSESPSLDLVPDLVTEDELARAATANTAQAQAVYKEIRAMLDEKAREQAASRPTKSLAKFISSTPHISTRTPGPDSSIAFPTHDSFSTYLYPEQIDAYICEAEESPATPITRRHATNPAQDLLFRNQHSAYNWLRKHHPESFIQDGEASQKIGAKPGSLRGAGKRSSMPAPSKPDALEIVEEDGMHYDPTIAGLEPAVASKGKRKREDDGGYHPKLGAPDGKAKRARPKKKKAEGETSAKKSRAKPKVSEDTMVVDEASASIAPAV